ncbi:unnamed protein product [Polarella glacialis]|uniref:Uncharacterized protein n=1 Tax=Polarella glacialis TaxID=89957 RepID=A0A813L9T4_POLGL|nr:unnamed protein product [Polarella glacialis]CAE8718729.1 unnamed protein product [Polarella glacialis]
MPPPRIQVINGIQYPRDVPVPEGCPEGWKGVEQAYGPASKTAGKTYIRYHSLDGKHKSLMGPKQIVQAHCTDKNIPWEPEYAKYEKAMEDRRDAEAEIRNAEREARGFAEGAKREEMIALSRARYGDLTGEIVFGFPGWKCRWDLLPESQQTPKTFTAPDGLQWKLLKDVECMFGTRISKGGQEVEDIDKMVEAGKKNTAAHELFHTGSGKARDYGGVVELEAGKAEEITWTREEEEQKREIEKAKKSEKSGEKDFLPSSFSPVTYPVQTGWAILASSEDRQRGFVEFKSILLKRKFPEDTEFVAVHDVAEACRFASRIGGIYHQMGKISGRRCYQKLVYAPEAAAGIGCDGLYLMWNASLSQWQISLRPSEKAPSIAYCREDQEFVKKVSSPWQVQLNGFADFQEDSSLKITAATG